jgi:hypothetical protein
MSDIRTKPLLAVFGFFMAFLLAATYLVPTTCRLKIKYTAGSYQVDCAGDCSDGTTCDDKSVSNPDGVYWNCFCGDAADPCTVPCAATFKRDNSGTHSITCVKDPCQNTCLKANLPPAEGVWTWACTCPDA